SMLDIYPLLARFATDFQSGPWKCVKLRPPHAPHFDRTKAGSPVRRRMCSMAAFGAALDAPTWRFLALGSSPWETAEGSPHVGCLFSVRKAVVQPLALWHTACVSVGFTLASELCVA